MSDPYIGQIIMVGFDFAPRNWAVCNGQLLPIAQNTALFSLLGTTYGGNGQTTFALPDLRGRAPMHSGNGVLLGEASGAESVTLLATEMPAHTHTVAGASSQACSTGVGTSNAASGRFPAVSSRPLYADTPTGTLGSAPVSGSVGGSLPHNNMQPFLTVNFVICLYGIFPSRN